MRRDNRIYVRVTNNASNDSWYEVLDNETLKQAQVRQPGRTIKRVPKKEATLAFAKEQFQEGASLRAAETGAAQEYMNDHYATYIGYDD
jgi:hypothetical protein